MLLKEVKQICVELGVRKIAHLIFIHKYMLRKRRPVKPDPEPTFGLRGNGHSDQQAPRDVCCVYNLA